MRQEYENLSERMLNFAAEVILFVNRLTKTASGRYIAGQLTHAGASGGANYEEACGAESRADFIHKLQIALKEFRETHFWLRLVKKSRLVPESDPALESLLSEAKQLANIIGQSVVTAKKGSLR